MKQLIDFWKGRRKQGTTWAGLFLAALSVFGLPAEEALLAAEIVSSLGVPPDYAEMTQRILTGVIGAALIYMRGKSFAPPDNVVDLPSTEERLQSPAAAMLIAAAASMLLLTGCGAMGMNKQQYAGINTVELQTGGGCSSEDRFNQDTCRIKMIDGKEKTNVTVEVILADGTTYKYSAGDEKAFEGQAQRADVDKAVVKEAGGLVKQVIETVKPKVPD